MPDRIAKAVENIDEILAVDGIDMLSSAPSICRRRWADGQSQASGGRAADRPRRGAHPGRGRPMGTVPHPGCTWKDMFARGYQFVNAGSDVARLRDGSLADVKEFRALYRKGLSASTLASVADAGID
jgi:2-keto-3-deoxy-L-rhamnonate aldolase RhmA